MTKRLRLLAGICVVMSLALVGSCSKESSDASAGTSASTSQPSDRSSASDSKSAPIEVAQADQERSAAAYGELLGEIRTMEQASGGDQQAMLELIGKMEGMFKDFIAKYPESTEANDARFQLGLVYTTLQRAPAAVQYLKSYIEMSNGETPEKVGYAHFYLADALKAADEFEEAKKHYQIFVTDYPTANPNVLAQAKMALEDLETWKQLAIGAEPIPFNVKSALGDNLDLAKYKGKVVLLDFWATWCGPCRVEMPNVVRIHKKYKSKGFEIIGVSLDQSRAAFDRYIKANDMVWPQHFDGRGWNNEIAMKYKIRSIPATFLLDRKGKIRYRAIRGKALEEAVQKLINETS